LKTLAVILHYNTPQYTDVLYEMLAPEQESGQYDLVVIDNGSDIGKESKYNTYKLDENIYFGGGLNAAMNLVLEDDNYDSLLFLNSDLIVGKNFVKTLKAETKSRLEYVYDVVTPCIIQPEKTQNHWKQMLPHGSTGARPVDWIDLQCPLITKKFITKCLKENNGEFFVDPLLLRGWGIDVLWGIIAKKHRMLTGVCDHIPAVHLGSATMKVLGNTNEYCRLAEQGMIEFFGKNNLMKEFTEMRQWAESYKL